MKMFKDYTLHWWQFGLLKMSLIAFGILVGSYWSDIFKSRSIIPILWLVFIVPAIYLIIVTLKQSASDK